MAEDALERLMQRQRPSVPPRPDGLGAELPVKSPQQVAVGGNGSGYSDSSESTGVDVSMSVSQDDEAELPQLVRTTTRLEEEIDTALRHLCMDEKITKEVWFEAAYLYLIEHPKAMQAVNGVAKERYQRRKRAADLRKLETMQKRLRG
ncbi:hypothetical protein IQ265_06065 [Nodosilinea sp. LEGE 06152]|uniref:hypothetical protein n=1 Tax=Nodosilinea sp. LEGE 06152 TaxID=2777966 RepID=UPI0018805494|nr:hypothetical protein [Nodosilinea sp. LEGE 06152]MBE9156394.1 hypothetical protein [Nodosilinea sp. LEGE 06152]